MKFRILLAAILAAFIFVFLRLPRVQHLQKNFGELNWKLKESQYFVIGEYQLSVDVVSQILVLFKGEKILLTTKPGEAFLNASKGKFSRGARFVPIKTN